MISKIRRKLKYKINRSGEDVKFNLFILIINKNNIKNIDIIDAIGGKLLNEDKNKSIIEYRGHSIYIYMGDKIKIEVDGYSTPGNFISFIMELSEKISEINRGNKVNISLKAEHYVDWDKPAIKDSKRSYYVNSFVDLDNIVNKYIKDQYSIINS